MKKILLVGKNSFIGNHLLIDLSITNMVDCISHLNIDDVKYNDYDVIINCSIHPDYRNQSYSFDKDMDLKISRKFSGHFIMLSSRKVYGTNDNLLSYTEEFQINPSDYYGWNKSTTEKLLDMEHDNHTILRASNVFGFEYQRKSYMGFLMNQLKNKGNIEIDISPFTTRDFINVEDTSKLINLVVEKEIKGTYNLSSGVGEMVGYTADYLIKGYGSGSLISKSKERKDQFILDNKKLLNALNIDIEFDIENQIIKLGEQLCRI